jgi:hypothetical protein
MTRMLFVLGVFVLIGTSASAHRLDEYLQGTILSLAKDRLSADLTLTPGVAIFPVLIRDIDVNADGAISEAEQRAYANRVLGDLSLSIDGHRLSPRLRSAEFPPVADMKDGRGDIHIEFFAELPRGGQSRRLLFENHHEKAISVYQVNVLVPRDPDIRIDRQNRNYSQSQYELDFDQVDVGAGGARAFIASLWGQFATMVLSVFAMMTFIRVLRKRRVRGFESFASRVLRRTRRCADSVSRLKSIPS